jgi:anthranilate synthase/aminodeoxychorismate synthase-like glutamine amidotransferase
LLLLVDNYDSFTFNLRHALEALGEEVEVARNDALDPAAIDAKNPEILVISPGPGSPAEAGVSVAAIAGSLGRRPILGVCLGHQALAAALGGRVRRARELVHGKARAIRHDGRGLFVGIPDPALVARYHSLVVDEEALPRDLAVTARSEDGEIMALAHRRLPVAGVQFHPESFLTAEGPRLLTNFLRAARGGAALAG